MPVSSSAKKALRVSARRKQENVATKALYKKAVKGVRKAVQDGVSDVASLFSKAQSAIDTAAKRNTIHRNKAARLKSRLAKQLATPAAAPTKKASTKTSTKKATPKATNKK